MIRSVAIRVSDFFWKCYENRNTNLCHLIAWANLFLLSPFVLLYYFFFGEYVVLLHGRCRTAEQWMPVCCNPQVRMVIQPILFPCEYIWAMLGEGLVWNGFFFLWTVSVTIKETSGSTFKLTGNSHQNLPKEEKQLQFWISFTEIIFFMLVHTFSQIPFWGRRMLFRIFVMKSTFPLKNKLHVGKSFFTRL